MRKEMRKVVTVGICCLSFALQSLKAEGIEHSTKSLDGGIERKILITRNKNEDILVKELTDYKGEKIIRTEAGSSRYDKQGKYLENGTTIKEFDEKGRVILNHYLHDAPYRYNMKYEKKKKLTYFSNGKLSKEETQFSRINHRYESKWEYIYEYYDTGKIRLSNVPIWRKGEKRVGLIERTLGVKKSEYTYYDNNLLKKIVVTSVLKQSKKIKTKHAKKISKDNAESLVNTYEYDNQGNLITDLGKDVNWKPKNAISGTEKRNTTNQSLHPLNDFEAGKLRLKMKNGDEMVNISIPGCFRGINQNGFSKTKYVSPLPEAIEFLQKRGRVAHPGISLWLKRNPDIFTVSSDEGEFLFTMGYSVLNSEKDIIMAQAPGCEPIEIELERSDSYPALNDKEEKNPYFRNVLKYRGFDILNQIWEKSYCLKNTKDAPVPISSGASDYIDHHQLSDELRAIRATTRNNLRTLIGKETPIQEKLDNNVIVLPIYIAGEIVSSSDKFPIRLASVWLKRNPFIMHRTRTDGKFELMMKRGTLYLQDDDNLMVSAPGFISKEISIKSYLEENITVSLKPIGNLEKLESYKDMVKVPRGFIRLGRGVALLLGLKGINIGPDPELMRYTDWPIRTVYMPSFYVAKSKLLRDEMEIKDWANVNGYTFISNLGKYSFPYAVLMCNVLSEREGRTPCYYTPDMQVYRKGICETPVVKWDANGYRIATGAEYDYVTRAGGTTDYPWGNNADAWGLYSLTADNSRSIQSHDDRDDLISIGLTRKPNAYGLYGNGVCEKEWTWDMGYNFDPEVSAFPMRDDEKECVRQMSMRFNRIYNPTFPLTRMVRGMCDWWFSQITVDAPFWQGPYGVPSWRNMGYTQSYTYLLEMNTPRVRLITSVAGTHKNIKLEKEKWIKNSLPKPEPLKNITKKIDLVNISGGSFPLGITFRAFQLLFAKWEPVWTPTIPVKEVSFSDFQMSRFEITYEQWKNVYDWAIEKGYNFDNAGSIDNASSDDIRHPVNNISWNDTIKWCNAASEKADLDPCYFIDNDMKNVYRSENISEPIVNWNANGYRLPTEAEWEYAAKGNTNTYYYWGDVIDYDFGWFFSCQDTKAHGDAKLNKLTTHPVGQKKGNQFGLYDMVGNVWEWCWDWRIPLDMVEQGSKNPHGPQSANVAVEYWKTGELLSRGHKGKQKKAIILEKKATRTLKGLCYRSKMGAWSPDFLAVRGSDVPENKSSMYGFRVVRGK